MPEFTSVNEDMRNERNAEISRDLDFQWLWVWAGIALLAEASFTL